MDPDSTLLEQFHYHLEPRLSQDLFRKNTKQSIQDQVYIPEPNIETEFLTQTQVERAIYDSALGDTKKMIQFCNHILVSEHHISILGNDPLSLSEIHQQMTSYYQRRIQRLSKRLENIAAQLEQQEMEQMVDPHLLEQKEQISQQLAQSHSKYGIFNSLPQHIEETKTCPVCYESLAEVTNSVTPCGHLICGACITTIFGNSHSAACPMCRHHFNRTELQVIKPQLSPKDPAQISNVERWGTKMARMVEYLQQLLSEPDNRVIVFSQWDSMLRLVARVLEEVSIKHLTIQGSMYVVNSRIRKFKLDPSIRVVLLSSDRASSGLNLTEANHVILLDTLNTDQVASKLIEEQAIGRAVRLGQKKTVEVRRMIMLNTIEYDFYLANSA